MKPFHYVSEPFKSNCLVEALKAKLANRDNVKIYFCRPRFVKGKFQMLHFMWSNGKHDYDFSDDESRELKWYEQFWFEGKIRQFDLGFAKRYSEQRNRTSINDLLDKIYTKV